MHRRNREAPRKPEFLIFLCVLCVLCVESFSQPVRLSAQTEVTEETEVASDQSANRSDVPILARAMFGLVDWAARKGLAESSAAADACRRGQQGAANRRSRRDLRLLVSAPQRLRDDRAKLHLSRHEGRNRSGRIRRRDPRFCRSENADFARATRLARPRRPSRTKSSGTFREWPGNSLREYRASGAPFRFDILAIEAPPGQPPVVRLHKGAFAASENCNCSARLTVPSRA